MNLLHILTRDKTVATLARWILGAVFLAASLTKIADPASFATNIAAYRLLPFEVTNIVAIVMMWTEFLVGLALINGVAARGGALLAAVLNVVFILAAASAMARGLDIECGCFTGAKSTVGWSLIGRDLVFLALAALVLAHRGERAGAATTPESVSPEPVATAR